MPKFAQSTPEVRLEREKSKQAKDMVGSRKKIVTKKDKLEKIFAVVERDKTGYAVAIYDETKKRAVYVLTESVLHILRDGGKVPKKTIARLNKARKKVMGDNAKTVEELMALKRG